jgi:hypothetical protein
MQQNMIDLLGSDRSLPSKCVMSIRQVGKPPSIPTSLRGTLGVCLSLAALEKKCAPKQYVCHSSTLIRVANKIPSGSVRNTVTGLACIVVCNTDLRHFTGFRFHCHVGTRLGCIQLEYYWNHFAVGIYWELVKISDWSQWKVCLFHVFNNGGMPITMNTLVVSIIINSYVTRIISFYRHKFVDIVRLFWVLT